MALSVGFRITVSLLILLPKLRGSDSYPGGTDSHRTRPPSLDAHRQLPGKKMVRELSHKRALASLTSKDSIPRETTFRPLNTRINMGKSIVGSFDSIEPKPAYGLIQIVIEDHIKVVLAV